MVPMIQLHKTMNISLDVRTLGRNVCTFRESEQKSGAASREEFFVPLAFPKRLLLKKICTGGQ